jgi:hypothetical protein
MCRQDNEHRANVLVNVHANQALTPPLQRIGRQQSVRWGEGRQPRTTAGAGRCRARMQVQAGNDDGRRMRPQPTGQGRLSRPVTAANTAAKPLDNPCRWWTDVECRPSARTATDNPGRVASALKRQMFPEEARARCVPDRTANLGNSRSLTAKPTPHPSWDGSARRDQADDLLSSRSRVRVAVGAQVRRHRALTERVAGSQSVALLL